MGSILYYEQRIMTTGGHKLNEENNHSEHSCVHEFDILTFEFLQKLIPITKTYSMVKVP